MSDTQSLIILDERDYRNQWLAAIVNEFSGFLTGKANVMILEGRSSHLKEFTHQLLEHYLKYAISRHVAYCEGESAFQEYLADVSGLVASFLSRHMDGAPSASDIAKITTEGLDNLVESDTYLDMDAECYRQLQLAIPPADRWKKCTLVTTGGFYAIAKGRDYRIMEYERLTGNEEDADLTFDFSGLFNMLRDRISGLLGELGEKLPFRLMVAKVLEESFPTLRFDHRAPQSRQEILEAVLEQTLPPSKRWKLERSIADVIVPVVKLMVQQLELALEKKHTYTAVLSRSGILTVEIEQKPITDSYLQDILNAIENGDYVPERERRLAGL